MRLPELVSGSVPSLASKPISQPLTHFSSFPRRSGTDLSVTRWLRYSSDEREIRFVLTPSGSDHRNHLPLRKGRKPKRQRMIPIAAPTGLKHQLRATLWGLKCNNNDRHNHQESSSSRASMCRAIFPIYYRISSTSLLI